MKMRTTLLTLFLTSVFAATAFSAEFYVATGGADDNPGTQAKPFGTFRRAQQAARAERATHPDQGVTVTFLAGFYPLERTLEFTPADSGISAAQPVRYVAEAGAEVVISGGRRITGWQPDAQRPGVWKTLVSGAKVGTEGAWRFQQLWVNGQSAIRARTPNDWNFSSLLGISEGTNAANGRGGSVQHTFTTRPQALAALRGLDGAALHEAQVVVFHKWDTTRETLETASPEQGVFTTRGARMQSWNTMSRDCLFYLENTLSALDAPGEWFLDRDGWLYYQPRAGEDMARAEVIAPVLERFLSIQGQASDPGTRVQHLRFEGLKFRQTGFQISPRGLPPAQAAMNVDVTAIQVDAARDILFTHCAVEHIGSTAFWFRHACRDCRVEHTRMVDLGIGGVRIGEAGIVPEAVRTGGITVDNCIIQSGGRIMPHTVAVWIGHSPDNAITHCDIGDFFYTAVSVGWRWGYAESAAKRNRIEFNHLHHLGYRILSDMGGVYTLGPSEGTRVCNNVVHDVYSTRYGGWGLYPDEGSTGILFENNLVYDVRDGCVHQHYGKENVFRNNILAFSEEGQIAITRAEPHLSFTFERNLVYWDEGHLLGYGGWRGGAKVALQSNLYWRAHSQPFDFGGKTFEQWRAAGKDEGSLIADPLFRDVEHRDFRLRPGSPAEKIGFKPFDFSQAGVYGEAAWKELARSVSFPKPYVVPPSEPLSLQDDFERAGTTALLEVATLEHEGHKDLITTTDTVAASGKCSLRIQDDPSLKASYNPHFYWDPQYRAGRGLLGYAIRLEPGANARCEWRDHSSPYLTGPSVEFHDRAVFVRGKKLTEIPENAWVRVEMRAPLGQAGSTWELTISLPGGTPQQFKNLACDPAWKEARWVGFSSFSAGHASYYLDDLVMENR